jgi:hypothetical protein
MGGKEVKRVRVGAFIKEEIRVDKNQTIWPSTKV